MATKEERTIRTIINSPLPVFKLPKIVNVEKTIEDIDAIDDDEEEFLLMAI